MNLILHHTFTVYFPVRRVYTNRRRWFVRGLATLVLAALWSCTDQRSPAQISTNSALPEMTNGLSSPKSPSPGDPPAAQDNASSGMPSLPQTPEETKAQKRFELYLSAPQIPKEKVDGYLYNVSQVLSLLANNNPSEARNVLPALTQCPEIDAGLTDELEAKIDAIGEIQRLKKKIEKTDNDLQKSIDKPESNPDDIADSIRKQSKEQGRTQGPVVPVDQGTNDVMPPPAGMPATPQLTQEYIRSVQTEAKIQANEQDKNVLLSQAKAEFGLYVSRLYNTHHYYQVVMAAGFYRDLFNESNYPADMTAQVTEASDLNNKVSIALKTFRDSMSVVHIAKGADQLQQAFRLCDTYPGFRGVPSGQKTVIKTFEHELTELRSLIEARNFADLDSIVHDLSQTAPDFDVTPTKQFVDTVKNNSEVLLKKGKLLLRQGDSQNAINAFQEAEKLWPNNPDLLGGALSLLKSEENRNQLNITFDNRLTQRDFAGVYEQRAEFATVFADDPSRIKQLQAAIEMVDSQRGDVEKAKTLRATGNVNGAWEIIEVALTRWPENVELNKLREELSDGAADFTLAIGKAQYAESQNELGYSLSWYAVAQNRYPLSSLANEGILRLTKEILNRT